MLDWVIDSLILSLFIGSIYVLVSLGLTLTLAVLKLPNFAHAEFLTIGGYTGVIISRFYPNNLLLMSLTAFLVCGAIAVLINYTIFRPLIRKVSIYMLVLSSFAVGTLLRYSIFIFATATDTLDVHPSFTIEVVANIGKTSITNIEAITIPLAILISILLGVFLNRSVPGKSMRAIASNLELARVTGVKFSSIVTMMWIIAGGLAGLGGVFLGVYTSVTPVLGFNVLLEIFAVVIIAGLTSMSGTILGGYIVGAAENFIMTLLANSFGLPFTFKPILPFAMILVVLMFKPTGLTPNVAGALLSLVKKLRRAEPVSEGW